MANFKDSPQFQIHSAVSLRREPAFVRSNRFPSGTHAHYGVYGFPVLLAVVARHEHIARRKQSGHGPDVFFRRVVYLNALIFFDGDARFDVLVASADGGHTILRRYTTTAVLLQSLDLTDPCDGGLATDVPS